MNNVFLMNRNIQKAIRVLLKNDLFLLINDSDEWAISHKFAEYIQKQFPEWHVDVEYNRDKDQIKTGQKQERVRPDIIVHIRNTDYNLLIFEIKKSNNLENLDDDRRRLEYFTSAKGKFRYQLGVLIIFYVKDESNKAPIFEYYKNGTKI